MQCAKQLCRTKQRIGHCALYPGIGQTRGVNIGLRHSYACGGVADWGACIRHCGIHGIPNQVIEIVRQREYRVEIRYR